MKIYTKIVFDMDTLETVEAESFDYPGPLSLCLGGGSSPPSTTTQKIEGGYDAEYNARMAAIAESQQGLAQEMFTFWRKYQAPLEAAQSATAMRLLPQQENYARDHLSIQQHMLPEQGKLSMDELSMMRNLQPMREFSAQKFYEDANAGVEPEDWAARAGVDVGAQYAGAEQALRRDAMRMGLDPSSGRFAANQKGYGLAMAKDTAQAMTQARRAAEDENFRRRTMAAAYNYGA